MKKFLVIILILMFSNLWGKTLNTKIKEAIFAGGCFWCMEYEFEKLPGVIDAVSGYTGGNVENPTYKEVCSGKTGYYEAVLIKYNSTKISFERLLEYFWKHIDPTDERGQFFDKGSQYHTAIFYKDEYQKNLAAESKRRIEISKIFTKPIVTKILPAKAFYKAEDYHQNYYKTCPVRFRFYHNSSGRDKFLYSIWSNHKKFRLFPERKRYWIGYKKPDISKLKELLTPLQFMITQKNGTEPPFNNKYWNNHKKGIYVDIVSGEPLFSSKAKFDSGTGWISFTKPIDEYFIVKKDDNSFFMKRTEVRSRFANSHLGHVFNDGPKPTGLRYCINSGALFFIPYEKLDEFGYSFYKDKL
jgi:peptide methionine sulfoxide reductase msrA/msrB